MTTHATVGKVCVCKRIVMPGEQHRCDELRSRDRRRHDRQRDHGRDRRGWRSRLRETALERDDRLCQLRLPGCTEIATSVHLRPELEGNHDDATIDDVVSSCAHCHGVLDGGRSQRQVSSARPAPRAPRISDAQHVANTDNA